MPTAPYDPDGFFDEVDDVDETDVDAFVNEGYFAAPWVGLGGELSRTRRWNHAVEFACAPEEGHTHTQETTKLFADDRTDLPKYDRTGFFAEPQLPEAVHTVVGPIPEAWIGVWGEHLIPRAFGQ